MYGRESAAIGKALDAADAAKALGIKVNAAPRPVSDVETIHDVLAFANTLANRAIALADATCGAIPQPGNTSDVAGVEDGVMPRVVSAAHYTRGRLGDAMEALGRIERSLGVVG